MSQARKKYRGWNFFKPEDQLKSILEKVESQATKPEQPKAKVNIYRTEDPTEAPALKPLSVEEFSHKIDRETWNNIASSLADINTIKLDENVGTCLKGTFTRSKKAFNPTGLLLCFVLIFNFLLWVKQKEIMHCLNTHTELLSSLSEKYSRGLKEIAKLQKTFLTTEPKAEHKKANNLNPKRKLTVRKPKAESERFSRRAQQEPSEFALNTDKPSELKLSNPAAKASKLSPKNNEVDFSAISLPPAAENSYPILSDATAEKYKQEEVQPIQPSKDIVKRAANTQEKGTYDFNQIFGSGLYKNRR